MAQKAHLLLIEVLVTQKFLTLIRLQMDDKMEFMALK